MNHPGWMARSTWRLRAPLPPWWQTLLVAVSLWSGVTQDVVGAGPLAKPRYTPTERLKRERLAAAQESIDHLALLHRNLPIAEGLLDLRAIFHAHAEDSAHTGGTRPELLADAVTAGVQVVFLSDHYRPPRDFMDSWRLVTNGVLFVPGSECRGFLAHPDASVMSRMESPILQFVEAVGKGSGLIFLSHLEERPDHSVEGLTGLEIYNRHYDAKRDMAGLIGLAMRLTDPTALAEFQELVRIYPDGVLAAQVQYPELYLEKWDREGRVRPLVGVAANDCHHNQIFILRKLDEETAGLGTNVDPESGLQRVKVSERPGLRTLLQGRKVGEVVAEVDLDPYLRAFRCVSTHVLAREKTETAVRAAVRSGRVFVAHEWMGDATGFDCSLRGPEGGKRLTARMGDTVSFQPGMRLRVESPLPGVIRLLRDGVEETRIGGEMGEAGVRGPGVVRVEVWLEIGGELRPWIYGNPIYVRPPTNP